MNLIYPIIKSLLQMFTHYYFDCAKCLLSLFNTIWDSDFPEEWNSTSIISIPKKKKKKKKKKKGDLSECNN